MRTTLFLLAACTPVKATVVPDVATKQEQAEVSAADEPAFLAGIFRHTPVQELSVVEHSVEKRVGEVNLELRFFQVAGIAPALAAQVNDAVRKLGRIDEYEKGVPDHGGTVWVTCSAGLAYAELVSFGCDILDSTLTLEDIANATGGAPAAPTGAAQTFALVDGKLTPVALADVLVPSADLAALAKRAATEDEFPEESWSADRCTVGENPVWQLERDGMRVWDQDATCLSILVPYEILAPAIEPGGVIARYLAITSTGE